MGFSPNDFNAVRQAPSHGEAVRRLEDLRIRFRKAFRKAAFELHPDRTGGDPYKTEQFNLLVNFARDFEKVQVPKKPPVVVHRVVFYNPVRPHRPSTPLSQLRVQVRTTVTPSNAASAVAGMRPAGVK